MKQLESLALTIHVFRCPLFRLYLKPIEENKDKPSKEKDKEPKTCKEGIENILDKSSKGDLDKNIILLINEYNIFNELKEVEININKEAKKTKEHFGNSVEKFKDNIKILENAGLWNEIDERIREYFVSTKDRRVEILNVVLRDIKKDLFTGVAEGTLKKIFKYVHENK